MTSWIDLDTREELIKEMDKIGRRDLLKRKECRKLWQMSDPECRTIESLILELLRLYPEKKIIVHTYKYDWRYEDLYRGCDIKFNNL